MSAPIDSGPFPTTEAIDRTKRNVLGLPLALLNELFHRYRSSGSLFLASSKLSAFVWHWPLFVWRTSIANNVNSWSRASYVDGPDREALYAPKMTENFTNKLLTIQRHQYH